MHSLLIVRLGSLGDIVHALPVAAALREAFPQARLDWVVDERHLEFLELVPVVDRRVVLRTRSAPPWRGMLEAVTALRRAEYDVALDLQGLLKSAVLARASGAARVLGFSLRHLRERAAQPFYTETREPGGARHVIDKNLSLLEPLGVTPSRVRFPIDARPSAALDQVRRALGSDAAPYALLNPGAGWPNKRWPPERFGLVAARLRARHALPSVVLWGPGERALADAVVAASNGTARTAPETTVADLVALGGAASLVVGGDTGPIHIAAALGTPVVGVFGPTDPGRNGPWGAGDLCASRFERCACHHKRRCRAQTWCLDDISADEVMDAVDRRLATAVAHG